MNTINLKFLSGNKPLGQYPLWHPYSSIHKGYHDSLHIVKGEDVYVYDINGKQYMDACSGLWNVSLGYSNENIRKAVIKQLNEIPFCSLFEHTNQTAIYAAKSILDILPGYMHKILFTCSGSESIELAVKLMRMYWNIRGNGQKRRIITLRNSYHGTFYASLSASSIEAPYVSDLGPLVPGFDVLDADCCGSSFLEQMETQIQKIADEAAGIIIEPILASYGVKLFSNEFFESIQMLCRKYDLMLVIDEVATGFYRTGRPFYFQKYSVEPDIICMAKGINGGYVPFGAAAVHERIAEAFQEDGTLLVHGSTQDGNLLGCASCIAAIKEYETLGIEQNVKNQGSHIISRLHEHLCSHKNVREIRGEGLMIEIVLCSGKEADSSLQMSKIADIQKKLSDKGLLVYRSADGLTIMPMLITTASQSEFIVDTILAVFHEIYYV